MARGKDIEAVCCEDNYSPKEKFKLFNSLFHLVYLVFQYDWFLLPICLPGVSCGTYCNENKCCVVTHRAADSRVAWLVYVCTYCVPIATYGQRPNNKLLSGSFSTSCLYWIRYTYPRTKKKFSYHDIIKNGLTSISEGWNPNLRLCLR